MSINRQTLEGASLQIGPTTEGMVRLYVETERFDLPMDFEPDEADEIAEELMAAARMIRGGGKASNEPGKANKGGQPGGGGKKGRDSSDRGKPGGGNRN